MNVVSLYKGFVIDLEDDAASRESAQARSCRQQWRMPCVERMPCR
jgi:hypothetical protein